MSDNLATVHYPETDLVIGTFPGISERDAAWRASLAL
jgi:hypothetical protein